MGLFAGISHFFGALGMLITSPTLIVRALIPAGVALTLSVLVMSYGLEHSGPLSEWIVSYAEEGSALHSALAWSSYLLIGLLGLMISPLLMILFGIPLCEPLAGRAHDLLGGQEDEAPFVSALVAGIGVGLKVVLITLLGNLALLLIGLIPPLGLVTAPFACWFGRPSGCALTSVTRSTRALT